MIVCWKIKLSIWVEKHYEKIFFGKWRDFTDDVFHVEIIV